MKGLPAERQSPFPRGERNSPFPIFDGGEIGTTPRGRRHRESEPRRPEWLKVQLTTGDAFQNVRRMTQLCWTNSNCRSISAFRHMKSMPRSSACPRPAERR